MTRSSKVPLPTHHAVAILLCLAASPAEPQTYGELQAFRDCSDCPEMVELPLGKFVMGAKPDEFRRMLPTTNTNSGDPNIRRKKEDEGPQELVTVNVPFAMARNEVTYDQWMACVHDGGCGGYVPNETVFQNGPNPYRVKVTGTYPVLFISYFDAQSYVEWLNKKTGSHAYRLPTEAEWEYAARAGTTTKFPTGDTITSDQANFSKASSEFVMQMLMPELSDREIPVKVDELDTANAWGLRHMTGNAAEWTSSCYTARLPGLSKTSDWLTAADQACDERVVRGGSWMGPIDMVRSASRLRKLSIDRVDSAGFRVVKSLDN